MQNISIYDIEAEKLEQLCDRFDTTAAEIVEALLDAVDEGDIKIEDYM